jgi:sulfate adenylyltransferase
MPSLELTPRDLSDLRLLAWGAYEPLEGFVGEDDYAFVVAGMRLGSGRLWPFPIAPALDVQTAAQVRGHDELDLITREGELIGVLAEPEVYKVDPVAEARATFGTDDPAHPGASVVLNGEPWRVGGKVVVDPSHPALALPAPFDRHPASPAAIRAAIAERGWHTVVAFQTRNPIHRAHEYLTKVALESVDGLLVHPLVGETKGDDIPAEVRLRCYEALLDGYYPADRVLLGLFPAPMRYAGPREAVFHALCRKNYGATHFIVGRDHAGVGDYYGTYAAQDLLREIGVQELGITPIFFEHSFYCEVCGSMASAKTCPHDAAHHVHLSGTKVRDLLVGGDAPPAEFTRPEIARLLIDASRPPLDGRED